eukprot:gnl/TRDRNA2_/TRDRNA2_37228_c0_seq1.p1 gnl/TRDRNA2_/TRDRNA2_37228_c0~~gnl/TRDRNA2_/TRDRNA2_37228_c0_seq1.p1  ORF type:complete len:235 (+),score=59.97 gnl/TRDRNA2_/TRDRNA2_37228_c0_seq1:59-763(+)
MASTRQLLIFIAIVAGAFAEDTDAAVSVVDDADDAISLVQCKKAVTENTFETEVLEHSGETSARSEAGEDPAPATPEAAAAAGAADPDQLPNGHNLKDFNGESIFIRKISARNKGDAETDAEVTGLFHGWMWSISKALDRWMKEDIISFQRANKWLGKDPVAVANDILKDNSLASIYHNTLKGYENMLFNRWNSSNPTFLESEKLEEELHRSWKDKKPEFEELPWDKQKVDTYR